MQVWESFLLAFSALLPLINPFSSALVFLGLVGDAPQQTYRSLARRIAINNVIFLAIIELLGSAILKFFGISLPIVQLSGGIVIASIGWSVLNEPDSTASIRDKRDETEAVDEFGTRALEQKAFYPFTFPVTSGPGTLVVMLTLTAHISNQSLSNKIFGHIGIFAAAAIMSLLVYLCYAYAVRLTKAVSQTTAHGMLRVMAFILLCIGVQIAWNGLSQLLHSVVIQHR